MSIAQEVRSQSIGNFPSTEWNSVSPSELGFAPGRLDAAKRWLDDHVGLKGYRIAIVRRGRLIGEWNHNVARNDRFPLASAAKSIFSCILGIAIQDGKIPSADSRIIDFYPEAFDVPDGEGPKPGRFASEKDQAITFRQLISNTSG